MRQKKTFSTMEEIVVFCATPRKKAEIMEHLFFSSDGSFRRNYLDPLKKAGAIMLVGSGINSRFVSCANANEKLEAMKKKATY